MKYPFEFSKGLPTIEGWCNKVFAIGSDNFLKFSGSPSVLLRLHDDFFPTIKVTSEMIDISERCEVGRLCFTAARKADFAKQGMAIYQEFPTVASTEKLLFDAKNTLVECGITFKLATGNEVTIVASAFPQFISLIGVSDESESKPEYDLKEYKRVTLS